MKKKSYCFFAVLVLICVFSRPMLAQETDVDDAVREKAWMETITKGKAYLDAKEYDKAIKYFENAAAQFPDVIDAPYYTGYVYYKKDDLENAQKNFLKVIEAEPAHPEAYYFLSVIAYRKGDKTKAIEYLDKVTEIDKSFQNAYFNKGIACYDLGMYERSVKEFAYALYLRPTDAASLRGLMRSYISLFGENAVQPGDGAAGGDYSSLSIGAGAPPLASGIHVGHTEKEGPSDSMDGTRSIQVFVKGEARSLTSTKNEPIGIDGSGEGQAGFDIKFPGPLNMTGKVITFETKNVSGTGKLECIISDNYTKRTPPVTLGITSSGDDWKIFTVDIEEMSDGYLDISAIDKIRFELSAVDNNAGKEKPSILVRNIEIK